MAAHVVLVSGLLHKERAARVTREIATCVAARADSVVLVVDATGRDFDPVADLIDAIQDHEAAGVDFRLRIYRAEDHVVLLTLAVGCWREIALTASLRVNSGEFWVPRSEIDDEGVRLRPSVLARFHRRRTIFDMVRASHPRFAANEHCQVRLSTGGDLTLDATRCMELGLAHATF